MPLPTTGARTDEDRVEVNWAELIDADTGGSQITTYNLQWDKGSGTPDAWYSVQGASPYSTDLGVTLSSDIAPGSSYKFRVRAANIHGFGEFSDTLTVKAAGLADRV